MVIQIFFGMHAFLWRFLISGLSLSTHAAAANILSQHIAQTAQSSCSAEFSVCRQKDSGGLWFCSPTRSRPSVKHGGHDSFSSDWRPETEFLWQHPFFFPFFETFKENYQSQFWHRVNHFSIMFLSFDALTPGSHAYVIFWSICQVNFAVKMIKKSKKWHHTIIRLIKAKQTAKEEHTVCIFTRT